MIPGQLKKMDILMYNSIKKNKRIYTILSTYHIIQFLFLIIFVPINFTFLESNNKRILAIMIVAIILSFLNFLNNLYILIRGYGNNQKNNLRFLLLAQNGHIVNQGLDKKDLNNLQLCVSSTVYNQQNGTNINDEGLTENLRQKYQSVYGYNLQVQVSKYLNCFCNCIFGLGSVVCFIIMIIFLSQSSPSVAQIIICVIWLVLQFSHWKIMLTFVIVALSPLILTFFCIWVCCCAKHQQVNVELPPLKPITMDMIIQSQTCSICQQSFTLNEMVYQLNCAPQHIFHQGCLNKWLAFGKTCPTCRKPITA